MSKAPPEPGSLLAKWQITMRLIEAYGATAPMVIGARILDHYNRKTGRCNPSCLTMAKATHMERETAFRAAARLEREGWIRINKNPGRPHSFEVNWSRANDPEVTGDADLTSDGEVTTPVTYKTESGDLAPRPTGDVEVTQNTEVRNSELIHESKLEEFIAGSEVDTDLALKPIRRARTADLAKNYIGRAFVRIKGLEPLSGDRIDGQYPDQWFIDRVPADVLAAMVARCQRGELTDDIVRRVAVAIDAMGASEVYRS